MATTLFKYVSLLFSIGFAIGFAIGSLLAPCQASLSMVAWMLWLYSQKLGGSRAGGGGGLQNVDVCTVLLDTPFSPEQKHTGTATQECKY